MLCGADAPCTAVPRNGQDSVPCLLPLPQPRVTSRRTASRPARDPVGIKAASNDPGGTALPQIMARAHANPISLPWLSRSGVPISLSPSPHGAAFAAAEA